MSLTITPPWQRPYWYETSVQLILRDLCRSGDTVFDVGANIGGIATMLSQHVGPTGKVIAFEASPRTLGELHNNLSITHCVNVSVISSAVGDQDDQWLPFYFGASPVADTLCGNTNTTPSAYVPMITLDTFCQKSGLKPDVIKMDIEGGEFMALKGFEKTLKTLHPPLVLEISQNGEELHNWLITKGYSALDVASYRPFTAGQNTISALCNVLYYHPDNERTQHIRNINRTEITKIDMPKDSLITKLSGIMGKNSHETSLVFGDFEKGRYIVSIEYEKSAASIEDEVELAIGIPGELLSLHIGPLKHIASSYTELPVHLERSASMYLLCKRIASEKFKKQVNQISITKIDF